MGKVIVITGAGSGLGRQLALSFVSDGHTIYLLGRTLSKLEAVATQLGENAIAISCDISNPDSVRSAFATIGNSHPKIDVLINNAAFVDYSTLADASDAHILQTVNTNLVGTLFCSRSVIPMMERGGHIINVSSGSVEGSYPFHVVYQVTKGGIETMSKHLQDEVLPEGIRVSVVRAGPMLDEERKAHTSPEQVQSLIKAYAERGVDIMNTAVSSYPSVIWVFRSLINLPEDMHVQMVQYSARRP